MSCRRTRAGAAGISCGSTYRRLERENRKSLAELPALLSARAGGLCRVEYR